MNPDQALESVALLCHWTVALSTTVVLPKHHRNHIYKHYTLNLNITNPALAPDHCGTRQNNSLKPNERRLPVTLFC